MKAKITTERNRKRVSSQKGFSLIVLATISFFISFGGPHLRDLLQFNRGDFLNGEAWRALTAPLVHLNWDHSLLNIGTLLIIWALFGRAFNERAWILIIIGCSLAVSFGILFFNPEITWYVGLSGILYGFLTAGAIADWHDNKWLSSGVILFMVTKLTWEQLHGPISLSESLALGKVLVDTHLYGSLSGAIIGWALSKIAADRRKASQQKN